MHQSVDALIMSAYFHDGIVIDYSKLLLQYCPFLSFTICIHYIYDAIGYNVQKAILILRMHEGFL